MTTLPNMSLVLPTRGASGSGKWGDTEDANLGLVDAHDHSSGKGAAIPTAGLNINADLPFSSLYAPTQLHRVQFSQIAGGALTGSNNLSLFVSDGTGGLTSGELYFRTSTGNNIKFTAGSTLNVGAFAGTIGGDYVSVAASEAFVDASKTYTFKDGVANWARLQSGEVRVLPTGGATAFYVGMAAPGGIGASYTVTWPTALPGSTVLAQIDNTGQWAFTNTVPGLITANSGVTAASNQHVTVAGTGRFKHGTMTMQLAASAFVSSSNAAAYAATAAGVKLQGTGSGVAWIALAPIRLPDGSRILAIRSRIADSPTGPSTFVATLWSQDLTASLGTGGTSIASSSASAGTGAAQTLTISSLSTTIAASSVYTLAINCGTASGGATMTVLGAEVDYDFP